MQLLIFLQLCNTATRLRAAGPMPAHLQRCTAVGALVVRVLVPEAGSLAWLSALAGRAVHAQDLLHGLDREGGLEVDLHDDRHEVIGGLERRWTPKANRHDVVLARARLGVIGCVRHTAMCTTAHDG